MVFPPQRQLQNFMPRGNFMFPGQSMQNVPTRGIGGFLQNVLGANQNVGQVATNGVGGLSKTLNGMQQMLRVVETTTPIVKQYGPFVRNLPAMYRMMKAFNNMDSKESTDASNSESFDLESKESSSANSFDEDESPIRSQGNGESTPKLFI